MFQQDNGQRPNMKVGILGMIRDRAKASGGWVSQMPGNNYSEPDAANKAMLALLENGTPNDMPKVAEYIKWYDDHQKHAKTTDTDFSKVGSIGRYDNGQEVKATSATITTASSYLVLLKEFKHKYDGLASNDKAYLDNIVSSKDIKKAATTAYTAIANLTDQKDGLAVRFAGDTMKNFNDNLEVYAGRKAAAEIFTAADTVHVKDKVVSVLEDNSKMLEKLPGGLYEYMRPSDPNDKSSEQRYFASKQPGGFEYVDIKKDVRTIDGKEVKFIRSADENTRSEEIKARLNAAKYFGKSAGLKEDLVKYGILSVEGDKVEFKDPEKLVGHFINGAYTNADPEAFLVVSALKNSLTPEQYKSLNSQAEDLFVQYATGPNNGVNPNISALSDIKEAVKVYLTDGVQSVPAPVKKKDPEKEQGKEGAGLDTNPLGKALAQYQDSEYKVASATGTSIPNLVAAANKGKGGIA